MYDESQTYILLSHFNRFLSFYCKFKTENQEINKNSKSPRYYPDPSFFTTIFNLILRPFETFLLFFLKFLQFLLLRPFLRAK